jgi:alpha-ketoglutarate-dependent 2,4-dichlorophenoxyacetate dioxygenase
MKRTAAQKGDGLDFTTRPLHSQFAAEVRGCDLAHCDADAISRIEAAIGNAGLLLFRNVSLDDAELGAFAGKFGPLQNISNKPNHRAEVSAITNIAADGNLLPSDDVMLRQHAANELWHIDSTFWSPGATFSFLLSRTIPDAGGETEFCDTRVAWEGLPPERQAALFGLTTEHSIFHSRRLIGYEMPAMNGIKLTPVKRRLVRFHEPSNRHALIIASHVEQVEGLSYQDGRNLVDELVDIATRPDRTYSHKWKVGDLLMWDNRCILHRGTPYAYSVEPRDMRSCRVQDVADPIIN